MNERINKIMEMKGMNPTRFAAATEINPATLSNIFSGKTNPSTEVIIKILEKYSDINPDWLLFGKGDMLRTGGMSQSVSNNQLGFKFENKTNEKETVNKESKMLKNIESKEIVHIEKPAKTIDKLLIIYTDNSFETFIKKEK
jgi:transcriptional regulator with XRE-family HTH domain